MSGEVERLRRWFAAESREAALARRAGRAAPIEGPGQSYIGGLPRLPAHMAWPEADVGNQRLPLHFAAQIDLQDLPDVADRHLLPDAGILFFFMLEVCMSDPGAPFPSRVLFHPKSARFPERAPPSDLPTFWAGYGYRDWLGAGHPRRSVDFRYPITFKAVRTYFSHYWDDGEPASELYEELAAHALSEALGLLHRRAIMATARVAARRLGTYWPMRPGRLCGASSRIMRRCPRNAVKARG